MFGLGHTLTFGSRVSTLDRRGLLNYSFPRFRSSDRLSLTFTALYDNTRDVRTFTATRLEGSVQVAQKYSKATTFFYRYSYRRVGVSSLNISPLLAPQLASSARVGELSFNLLFDRRDDPVDPRKGIYTTLNLGIAERALGSQRNFSRFLGRNSTYHRIGRKLVLARDTTFGEMHAFPARRGSPAGNPPGGTFFLRRWNFASWFSREPGGTPGPDDGISLGWHGPVF